MADEIASTAAASAPAAASNSPAPLPSASDLTSNNDEQAGDDDDIDFDALENGKNGNIFTRALKAPFNWIGKGFEAGLTVVSAGAMGILDIILYILKIIWSFLVLLFTKIVPFIVMYVGIPAFILGVIMGLFFLGGHILLVIVFVVGIIYYIKSLVSVVYKLPDNTKANAAQK
jgi:hypothetical protein